MPSEIIYQIIAEFHTSTTPFLICYGAILNAGRDAGMAAGRAAGMAAGRAAGIVYYIFYFVYSVHFTGISALRNIDG